MRRVGGVVSGSWTCSGAPQGAGAACHSRADWTTSRIRLNHQRATTSRRPRRPTDGRERAARVAVRGVESMGFSPSAPASPAASPPPPLSLSRSRRGASNAAHCSPEEARSGTGSASRVSSIWCRFMVVSWFIDASSLARGVGQPWSHPRGTGRIFLGRGISGGRTTESLPAPGGPRSVATDAWRRRRRALYAIEVFVVHPISGFVRLGARRSGGVGGRIAA